MDERTSTPAVRGPLSTASLWYGIFLVVAVPMALVAVVGGMIGTVELAVWWVLLIGWVTYWMYRRRARTSQSQSQSQSQSEAQA